MTETIGPTPRREAVAVIGAWFDRPSVYMGGPSDRSIRKAEDLIDQLAAHGMQIMEGVPDDGPTP